MIRKLFLVCLLGLLVLPQWVAADEEYRLGPGDAIRINLWVAGKAATGVADNKETIQQLESVVRPDGKVAVAFDLTKSDTYRLGAGDVLSIGVWGYPEMQIPEVAVRPDGKIAFPLVGELTVAGLTPAELNRQMTQALQNYLKDPKVTVNVAKFRTFAMVREFDAKGLSIQELTDRMIAALQENGVDAKVSIELTKLRTTRIYVLGEVNKPGLCEIDKSHSLLDAIGAAGGFTKNAYRKRIYLVRGGQTDKYVTINLDNILKKGDLRENYSLSDGDLIYLGRNKMDFARDILPFIAGVYQLNHMDF